MMIFRNPWVSTHFGYETGHACVAVAQEDGLASQVTPLAKRQHETRDGSDPYSIGATERRIRDVTLRVVGQERGRQIRTRRDRGQGSLLFFVVGDACQMSLDLVGAIPHVIVPTLSRAKGMERDTQPYLPGTPSN